MNAARRRRDVIGLCLTTAMILAGACARLQRTPIVVPPEAVREWAYLPDGQTGPGRYVVRMTDGRREWEIEFPSTPYGTEVRVPLRDGGQRIPFQSELPGMTPADREMEEDRRAHEGPSAMDPAYGLVDEAPGKPGQRPAATGRPPQPGAAPRAGAPSPTGTPNGTAPPASPARRNKASYLVGVTQIKELYRTRNYSIALVQLVELEKDYPDDEQLLAMKGSIYRRMGRTRLAREAWERVLAIDPDNTTVAAALRELAEEEEKEKARPGGEREEQ